MGREFERPEESPLESLPAPVDRLVGEGCPTCDGPIALRASPAGLFGWCAACRRIARVSVSVADSGDVRLSTSFARA